MRGAVAAAALPASSDRSGRGGPPFRGAVFPRRAGWPEWRRRGESIADCQSVTVGFLGGLS
eukprot:scaffold1202_cov384-Prasinococcus_capsulatus_cf.AAC.14